MNRENMNTKFEELVQNSYNIPSISGDFYNNLYAELMSHAEKKRASPKISSIRVRYALGLSILLALVFLFIAFTPQGKAFAESIKHLFVTTDITEIPIDDPQTVASPTFVPTFEVTLIPATESEVKENFISPEIAVLSSTDPACEEDPNGYSCQIAKAERKIGFDLKELPSDPYTFKFSELYITQSDEVWIHYERVGGGSYLLLYQAIGDMSSMYGSVPEDSIQEVKVGEYFGEYVVGNYFSDAPSSSYKWGYHGTYRLRWTEGERRFELRHDGCVDLRYEFCSSSPDKLIRIAESLVYDPIPSSELRADYLKSPEEATLISGFTILSPTILPEGFVFDHGNYDTDLKQIRLSYTATSSDPGTTEILIVIRPLIEIAANPGEDWSVEGESVDINGYPGFYSSGSPYNHAVSWEENGMRITISFYASETAFGGGFTKDQVLEIARSLQ
jgi:hypothetical protein